MRLKKLIVHGFKSFADRTEFAFDNPITGIVGPNGCGKSNVVDAVKWVLGEQSAKSLRGDAMMDVIFNGSGQRKAAGMAEVTLVFENPRLPDGTRALNMDVDEVAVGRRLFRDGTSEYQVNNATTRLKDVRELFLDTGVGVDAYSVIEQGRVAAMLESNPQERRQIFEEAAGISRFKARKKESQRKLEKVEQNLLRVNDIVQEADKRLRGVKVQAGRARVFQEYTSRLAELRLAHALREYHGFTQQRGELDGQLRDAQFRMDDLAVDLARAQNELADQKAEQQAVAAGRQRLEYELVTARASLDSARQRQQYAQRQIEQIAEQIESFAADRQAATQKRADIEISLAGESANLEQLTNDLAACRKEIDQRQAAFREGQLRLAGLGQEIERDKGTILDLMRRSAAAASRLGAIEIETRNITAQSDRLSQRREKVMVELAALDEARRLLQEQLDTTLAELAARQAALERRKEESAQLGRRMAQLTEQLGAAREHRSGLLSRQNLLKDLEARREGVSEGVKSVLRQRNDKFPFIEGLVADLLAVDVEHAHVIEAALDGRDQWLVAADTAALQAAEDSLIDLEGRVNIICIDDNPLPGTAVVHGPDQPSLMDMQLAWDWNQHEIGLRLAIDLVRFQPQRRSLVMRLLGKTVVVDDLAAAAVLRRDGPPGYRYVTTAGDCLEADGTLRTGPLSAAMGLLSRRSELEAIGHQIAEVDHRIAQLAAQLDDGSARAGELEEELNGIRNAVYASSTAKVELSSAMAQKSDQAIALRREQPVLERELAVLAEQSKRLEAERATQEKNRTDLESRQGQLAEQVKTKQADHDQLGADLGQWSEQLTARRVRLGQVQEQQMTCQQSVQRQSAAVAELGQQLARIEQSSATLSRNRASVEQEMESAASEEAVLVERLSGGQEQSKEWDRKLAAADERVAALASRVESCRESRDQIEHQLHDVQVRLGELNVRIETLVSRAKEEMQIDLPERFAEYTAAAQALSSSPCIQGEDRGGGSSVSTQSSDTTPALTIPLDTGTGDETDSPVPQRNAVEVLPAGCSDWDAVAEEIHQLKEKIQRLGNVNVEAIGEQSELEQRQTFLTTQVTDLTESKRQLDELIATINAESGVRFEQTFAAVREHFGAMFRKLFGGGKADLVLETEIEVPAPPMPVEGDGSAASEGPRTILTRVDPLDAGIEIIAHPPGKKPVTISQLSGGEKTMTCVALLMSIFKSKPSPFCILDEVDAALDEANNQRFNLIVQEFLADSQFIIITHSKRTMQIADVLYGVTMQEAGVSRKVAVKFDQVDAEGRVAEQAAA